MCVCVCVFHLALGSGRLGHGSPAPTGTHWHPPALTAICSLIRNRITPFGMPEYDGGERFDLRLPYVDQGWVDEDADPVKQFRRFIGLDKKSKDTEIQSKKSYKGKGKK